MTTKGISMLDQDDHSRSAPTSIPAPQSRQASLELAKALYREFHARCFWHCPRELEITEELIPFVTQGLRTYGGHRGFALASRLGPVASRRPVPPTRSRHECP